VKLTNNIVYSKEDLDSLIVLATWSNEDNRSTFRTQNGEYFQVPAGQELSVDLVRVWPFDRKVLAPVTWLAKSERNCGTDAPYYEEKETKWLPAPLFFESRLTTEEPFTAENFRLSIKSGLYIQIKSSKYAAFYLFGRLRSVQGE
jgi:hypothetical protein